MTVDPLVIATIIIILVAIDQTIQWYKERGQPRSKKGILWIYTRPVLIWSIALLLGIASCLEYQADHQRRLKDLRHEAELAFQLGVLSQKHFFLEGMLLKLEEDNQPLRNILTLSLEESRRQISYIQDALDVQFAELSVEEVIRKIQRGEPVWYGLQIGTLDYFRLIYDQLMLQGRESASAWFTFGYFTALAAYPSNKQLWISSTEPGQPPPQLTEEESRWLIERARQEEIRNVELLGKDLKIPQDILSPLIAALQNQQGDKELMKQLDIFITRVIQYIRTSYQG